MPPIDIAVSKASNIRYAFVAASVFSPFLLIVSGALNNQQADNLLPAFFSTDNLTWFYWDQSRYGSIHSFLAFPIQNIRLNLIFQLLLRSASLIFVVVWLIETTISRKLRASKVGLVYGVALLGVTCFLKLFPESGDALIYGANAHPNAMPFALIAVSVFVFSSDRSFCFSEIIWKTLFCGLFWGIAIWTSIFATIWAPAVIFLQANYLYFRNKIPAFWIGILSSINFIFVSIWFLVFSEIAKRGGENSNLNRSLFFNEAIRIRYVKIPLLVAVILVILVIALSVTLRSGTHYILSLISAIGFLASVPLISSSTHIQQYAFMPRYFGVPFLAALIVLLVAIFDQVVELTPEIPIARVQYSTLFLRLFSVGIAMIGLILIVDKDISFGTGKIDASGFVNTGHGLTDKLELEVFDFLGSDPTFISGSYWYVWPLVFDYRADNREVVALTKKATHQALFSSLYSAKPVVGLCIGESIKCWGATINAKLNSQQLYFEVSKDVIGNLFDGTPVREMWVSKYPIRRLER